MLTLLLKYNWLKFVRYFQARKAAKMITICLFALLFLAMAVGIYIFFKEGFYFISGDSYFREAFSLYVYEMYLLAFSCLVIFSTFITGIFSLFRRLSDDWIIASPGFKLKPRHAFVQLSLVSLWPFLIIIFPALLAIKNVFGLNLSGLIIVLLNAVILAVFTVLAVLLFLLVIGKIMLIITNRLIGYEFSFKKYIFIFIILVAVIMFLVWQQSINQDLIKLFGATDVNATQASVAAIADNFKFLPSHIVAASIYSWQKGNIGYVILNFLSLIMLTVFLIILWWHSSAWFLDVWKALQEGRSVLKNKVKRGYFFGNFLFFSRNVEKTLFLKEFLIFVRNIKGLLWAGFLFFVWFLQAALNTMLSKNIMQYGLEIKDLPSIVFVIQFVTGIYFVSAFVLRFVFPAFSSERKTAWIFATAPIDYSRIFWAKLKFYTILFVVLGITIVTVNISFFNVTTKSFALSMAVFVTAEFFVIVYGLSLGAMFPNFETDDPTALSTSLPGLAFIIGSLIYGALGGWLLFRSYADTAIWLVVLFQLATVMTATLLIRQALKKITKAEFEKIII